MHFHTLLKPNTPRHATRVLAIGNMEGVHLGHAALLKTARALADAGGHGMGVLTFAPHPREFFRPELKPLNIMQPREKIEALWAEGADSVVVLKFNEAVARLSASEFIDSFCVKTLQARHIVTGANFRFGKNREGDAEHLAERMRALGLGYSCVEPVHGSGGGVISSTEIRTLLASGDMEAVQKLLGRAYSISGRVVRGEQRGRVLGFPTANLALHDMFLPKFGVYAVVAAVEGKLIHGVANLGMRPHFDGQKVNLEVHLFDFLGDLYGKRLHIELVHFIRPEQKFADLQLMIDQLGRDVLEAKQYLTKHL